MGVVNEAGKFAVLGICGNHFDIFILKCQVVFDVECNK